MALLKKSELRSKVRGGRLLSESELLNFSTASLLNEKRASEIIRSNYDIFLSHSYEDAVVIKGLRDYLVDAGFTVYVDWIEDPQLNRQHVSKTTAAVLRARMNHCSSLLYATSKAAKKSVWMPWELGYMDARTKARVAIVPLLEEGDSEFKGQEYLGLYPYVDRAAEVFWVNESFGHYVSMKRWLAGQNPV